MQALQYVCHCCHRCNWNINKLASLQDTLVLNNDPPNDWQSQIPEILSYLKGHPCPQLQGQVSIKHGWKEKPGQWVTAGSDWQVLAVDSSHTGGSHCRPAFKKNKAEIFMTLQKFTYRGNSSLACGYNRNGAVRVWRFGFETSRFQKVFIFLMVSDSVLKKFGIEKSIGFGIEKNLVSEKVSDSVSLRF